MYDIYDNREAANIADWVMEYVTGWKKIDRVVNKQVPLNSNDYALVQTITSQLLAHRPVQYVLGEAWFYGLKFFVDESVLIPRPETEELVEWILADAKNNNLADQRLMDIGTGSGCIPVSLKKNLPSSKVIAIDISDAALKVAANNAITNEVEVEFLKVDMLQEEQWDQLPAVDVLISNPPYITRSETRLIAKHVLDYEPSLALFVQDEDPLLFYRKIAELGQQHLDENGKIYLEINERFGEQTVQLFLKHNYQEVILKKDMQGKDRMIRAKKG